MVFYVVFFSLLTLLILIGQLTLGASENANKNLSLADLTVLVPFRNEAENLSTLLTSFQKQTVLPAEIILINDHSEDAFEEILQRFSDLPLQILFLEETHGKKAAIRKGIEQTKTAFVLTLDADVVLPSSYFKQLSTLPDCDATILPVKISSRSFFSFFNFDYYYLSALNHGLHFLKQPFTASGANLLFKKEVYQAFLEQDKNQLISSGDDVYFLHFLTQNKKEVQLQTHPNLAVSTKFPNDFKSILHQRIRWIKKGSSMQNRMAILLGIIGLLYQLGFYLLLIFNPFYWIEILLFKISMDGILFFPFLKRIREAFPPIRLIFFSLIYPLWMIFILIATLFVKAEWKGRKVTI